MRTCHIRLDEIKHKGLQLGQNNKKNLGFLCYKDVILTDLLLIRKVVLFILVLISLIKDRNYAIFYFRRFFILKKILSLKKRCVTCRYL